MKFKELSDILSNPNKWESQKKTQFLKYLDNIEDEENLHSNIDKILEYFPTEGVKKEVANSYLKKYHIDQEKFLHILGKFNDHYIKQNLIEEYLINVPLEKKVEILKSLNIDNILENGFLLRLGFATNPEVVKTLYNNEEKLTNFLNLAFEKKQIRTELVQEFRHLLTQENFFKLVNSLERKKILSSLEAFMITNPSKYAFLKEINSDFAKKITKLDLYFTEEGIKKISSEFSKNLETISLIDIANYYDFSGKISEFASFLKPDIRESIKDKFIFPQGNIVFSGKHLKNINAFRQLGIADEELRKKTILVRDLVNYFERKIDLSPISIEKIENSQIKLPNTEYFTEHKTKINESFKELLKSQENSAEKVVEFFNLILPDNEQLIINNQNELQSFCIHSKEDMAKLFLQGGFEKFIAAIFEILGTGNCGANLSNHLRITLYAELLKEEIDQILYPAFSKEVLTILNNYTGNDPVALQPNPFKNTLVDQNYLSFTDFCKAVERELYDANKKAPNKRDLWDLIGNLSGNLKEKLNERLLEEQNPQQAAAKVASYLILEKIPELTQIVHSDAYLQDIFKIIKEVRTSCDFVAEKTSGKITAQTVKSLIQDRKLAN